jgi:flagellar biosynthesis/type III secretory pathway protein FliH
MGMIKRADIERYTRDAYVMNLSDIEKRGKQLIESANATASSVVKEAQDERERLINDAHDTGLEQGRREGHAEGFEKGKQEGIELARQEHAEVIGQLATMWADQLGAFERGRDEMLEAARVQVIELAAAIAQRVVHRTIKLDPSVIVSELESVLSAITESSRLVIRVHPEDADTIREEIPSLVDRFASCEHAQVVTDPSLARGSCIAQTSTGGEIDASIHAQLDRITDAILPKGHTRGEILELPDNNDEEPEQGADTKEDAA